MRSSGLGSLLDTTDKTYQGAGFLAALAESEEGLDYRQTQTVTVEHKRDVTMDRETHIDIGAEVGTTIGGENYGVSVEAKLTTEFGTKVDNSQTDEESRSKETSKEINYLFPAGKDTLLTIATRTVSDGAVVEDQRRVRHGVQRPVAGVPDVGELSGPSTAGEPRGRREPFRARDDRARRQSDVLDDVRRTGTNSRP